MTTDDPPPDGGPWLFVASYFALPALVGVVEAITFERAGEHGFFVWMPPLLFMLAAPFVYLSRTRGALFAKSLLVGALALLLPLLAANSTGSRVEHDDVQALFIYVVGPLFVAGGAVYGALCGAIVLVAFWIRQRPRVRWLAAVATQGHPRYRLEALPPNVRSRFLRYCAGDTALRGVDGSVFVVPSAAWRR